MSTTAVSSSALGIRVAHLLECWLLTEGRVIQDPLEATPTYP